MQRFAVAIGAVALLALGGVAFAATTGDERINACVNNGDGTVRIVASASTPCAKGFHKLSWSAENAPATPPVVTLNYRKTVSDEIAPEAEGQARADCDSGDDLTGGGYLAGFDLNIFASIPVVTNPVQPSPDERIQQWVVAAENSSSEPRTLTTYALCEDFPPFH